MCHKIKNIMKLGKIGIQAFNSVRLKCILIFINSLRVLIKLHLQVLIIFIHSALLV